MIDTVVLRIHRLEEKYGHIVKYLNQVNTDTYKKTFRHYANENPTKTSTLFADTGRLLTLRSRTSINVPSSHYNISVDINKERDFIEFNFSLPKFLHSTNVLQFVDFHEQSINHTYNKFLSELDRFFNLYLPLPPDKIDVEINRIDFCFNQFFLSKQDSLRYLDEQRNLNIEYARADKNKFNSYDTTINYITDNYSFKIYHKGTEFRKNDYNKLIKNNPKNINVPEMAETSDKILRYELTARKGLLNYLFKQRIKGDENTMVNHNLSMISSLRGTKRNLIVNTIKDGKMLISASTKNNIELYLNKTINNKSFGFHLDSLWNYPSQKPIDLLENFEMPFDGLMFEHLHQFFWERVKKYQLGVKMGITDIQKKIKDHQEEMSFKNKLFNKNETIAQTGQLVMIATLAQYIDLSDLKTVLPKATYYRYKKKMEEFGISKHCPDIAVRPPDLDYASYFYYFGKYHKTLN